MKKNIFIGCALMTFTLLNSSCADFLNQEPISNSSVTGFYKTQADIEQGVAGAYNSLQSYKQYGANFIYFMEVRSDNTYTESITTSGGIYGDFDLFRTVPTNSILDLTWAGCYEGIQRCNLVLGNIDNVVMSEDLKNQYKGEMLFIRALTYFNLVRIWGDVPLVTKEVQDPFDAFEFTRTPTSEIYQQIVTDLNEASELLSEKVIVSKIGSATAGAANALLGKVYLTLKDYPKAEVALKKVIDSKVYKLLDNYADVFDVTNKNSAESIFEIQYNKDITDQGSRFANIFAPKGSTEVTGGVGTSLGDNTPTEDLYGKYEEGDLRKEISIGQVSDGRIYCKKFVIVPVLPNQSDANFIVLRYADVLLMYAEALNEWKHGPTTDAYNAINAVRRRGYGNPGNTSTCDLTEGLDEKGFREAVRKERSYELSFEGHRRMDLVRWGIYYNTIQETAKELGYWWESAGSPNYSVATYTINGKHELFPIPQRDMDLCILFNQNPKW